MRLLSIFKITMRIKIINKIDYIYMNGLQYWDVIKYDNIELLNEIKEKEENLYKKIEQDYNNYILKIEEIMKKLKIDRDEAILRNIYENLGIDYDNIIH
jgi:signal peptidase I